MNDSVPNIPVVALPVVVVERIQWLLTDLIEARALSDFEHARAGFISKLLTSALAANLDLPAVPEGDLTTSQAIEQIRERMAGMGYTSPIEAALSLVTTSAHFAFMTVDRPGKWDALCHEIAVISEAAKRLPALTPAPVQALASVKPMLQAAVDYHQARAHSAHALPGSRDRAHYEDKASDALYRLRGDAVQSAARAVLVQAGEGQ